MGQSQIQAGYRTGNRLKRREPLPPSAHLAWGSTTPLRSRCRGWCARRRWRDSVLHARKGGVVDERRAAMEVPFRVALRSHVYVRPLSGRGPSLPGRKKHPGARLRKNAPPIPCRLAGQRLGGTVSEEWMRPGENPSPLPVQAGWCTHRHGIAVDPRANGADWAAVPARFRAEVYPPLRGPRPDGCPAMGGGDGSAVMRARRRWSRPR